MIRITAFWARGYRSLRDLRLDTDRPFNVFYGPNGAGKSNILAAIEALFGLAAYRMQVKAEEPFRNLEELAEPKDAAEQGILSPDDRAAFAGTLETRLGATIEAPGGQSLLSIEPFDTNPRSYQRLTFEICFDWTARALRFSRIHADRDDGAEDLLIGQPAVEQQDIDRALRYLFGERLARYAYTLVSADRFPRHERETATPEGDLLRSGKLIEVLYRASMDPNPNVRKRFKALRALLEGPPLGRPPFDIVRDPASGELDLREPFEGPTGPFGEAADISLRLAGLGIMQIYSILAHLLLPGTRAAAIEEPEAHLHALTTGRHLRALLERVVAEGHLDQLFIATHSNLFDLDPTGYHDVSHDNVEGTRVEWKPLSNIDREHLYEPGPAKHALSEFLRAMGEEDVGLRASK